MFTTVNSLNSINIGHCTDRCMLPKHFRLPISFVLKKQTPRVLFVESIQVFINSKLIIQTTS